MKLKKAATKKILRKNRELVKRLAAGDKDAPEELAKTNIPLVMHIAAKRGYGFLGADELTYHGRLAILHAASKFDPSYKTDFGIYAGYWIRRYLDNAVRDIAQLIRIPAVMSNRIYHVQETAEELERILERPPTEREIAKKLNISVRQVHSCLEAPTKAFSFQAHVGDEEGARTMEDLIPDADVLPPWMELERKCVSEWVSHLMDAALTPREAFLVKLRYGLQMPDGAQHEPMTLKELSEVIGLTRERVRQIVIKALSKLRERAELERAERIAGFPA